MAVLKFIFVLGINFSIFSFIWGIIMFVIKSLQSPKQQNNDSFTYMFRIVKYFLLVSVTANFIVVYEMGVPGAPVDVMHMVIGSAVVGLYLLGKLQNRAMMNQISQNPMFAKFVPKIDPKVERFLLIGSIVYFVACLWYPAMVDNGLTNWFTNAIISIYEAPIIGWIFSVIAFFFLISIIMRGANVIGRILNGESLTQGPPSGGNFRFNAGGNPFQQQQQEQEEEIHETEDGFTDYEDVTDEEDEEDS